MAKKVYPITIDETEHLFPMNEPVVITIGDDRINCTLHDLDGKGIVPVRHIALTGDTPEQRLASLIDGLKEWLSIGYSTADEIRDELEHGLTLKYQQEARKIVAGKEPSQSQLDAAWKSLSDEARAKAIADGYGAIHNASLVAARAAMAANGKPDPKRLFDELLGI